ncbi:3H domain-containing protein [Methanosphaera sp. ISO3-F5]|uniref:3H domain-containing protein n=1 Tax=Methanosphaera sp. ISO3-F5 TaxID=1452353 RepID=UPI002B25B19C|nr:3H domain-containing protein [Methanosphaera sp. ISO3-F5]WQH63238.1 3H domain-containing protein [Methanosphaera sp. ISO3-F5]
MMKPYVILIGSASGIGKSTIASEISKKLNIKYLIETDFIREIVRGIIGSDYAPALHKSSYDAYTTLRDKINYENEEKLIEAGFEEHASFVIPAVEKVIKRSIKDKDSIVIEGVHLVPGLINLDQFKNDANVYFFILTADKEAHQERFISRAIAIKRGGAQLDYFRENRIINDDLIRKANSLSIPVINNNSMENTLKKILQIINEVSTEVFLQHGIDKIELERQIITKHGGKITDISYYIPDFKEPLVRKIDEYDEEYNSNDFIEHINSDSKQKDSLTKLYELSNNQHSHHISAPDKESLDKIIQELTEHNLVIDKPKI